MYSQAMLTNFSPLEISHGFTDSLRVAAEYIQRIVRAHSRTTTMAFPPHQSPSTAPTPQVDFEESSLQGRFAVKPLIHPDLDESKCDNSQRHATSPVTHEPTFFREAELEPPCEWACCLLTHTRFHTLTNTQHIGASLQPEFMTQIAQHELQELDARVAECAVVCLPQASREECTWVNTFPNSYQNVFVRMSLSAAGVLSQH